MIYLSVSESQGLAMFEAWARNVSTLVWEKGEYEGDGKSISGKISAPYLTDQVGLAFSSVEDFSRQLEVFLKFGFNPRKYVEENFSNKIE